jgi:hypothetical protein
MDTVKKNLTDWTFWLSAAIVTIVVSLVLLPLVVIPVVNWLKTKFASATALIVASLILALTAQSTMAAPPVASDAAPAMLAVHTDTVTTGLVTMPAMLATIGNVDLAFFFGLVFAVAVFWLTSKRMARYCTALTGGAFVFGVLLFYPLKAAAAQFVDQLIARQIVIYAQSTSDGSNGFAKFIGPSGTNYRAFLTNGQEIYKGGLTVVTGFTGWQVVSNGNAGLHSNGWANGLLFCTNCPGATLPGNIN